MIEESVLKNALLSVVEHQVRQFPEPSEEDRRIARRLRPRIRRMIEKKESPITYYVKRIAVGLVLLLGITGVMLFGFNKSVHAGVIRWFQVHLGTNVYQYQNQSGENIDITKYTLQGIVPEGYQLFNRTVDEDGINETFVNESGDILSFVVMNPAYEGEVYVVSDAEKSSASIGRFVAEIYLSNDPREVNAIIWKDNRGILFVIQGFLSETELIGIAKQIE